jgi:sugar phosphate isomerase/epimerase
MPVPYRFAICNELFRDTPLVQVCKEVRKLGYEGLELAPFTLGDDPVSLSKPQRENIVRTIEGEGLRFVGFHWLLTAPPGLHITARDKTVRERTWNYVDALIDLCGDLAGSADRQPVVVFGSPKQRSSADGLSSKEAVEIFGHELAQAAPRAESRGVKLLVEALSASQTDVVNTLSEAVAIVKQIGSPAVETMFDTHNAVDEPDPHPELVRQYSAYIRHVHVNEMDGREPGMGDYDFAALLHALTEVNYSGWVSLEAFDFSRDPRQVAARAIDHLKACLPAAAAFA